MKKIKKDWTNTLFRCILTTLTLCTFLCVNGEEVSKKGESGARVKVKTEDALKLNDQKSLRDALLELQGMVQVLELENKTLREEKDILYRELLDINQKYQEQNESSRQQQLVLSGVVSSNGVRKPGEREDELFRLVDDVSGCGEELALTSVQFCEFVEAFCRDLPIGRVQRAEMQLKLDSLRKASNKFIALSDREMPKNAAASCRILAVNRELGCVILSAGSVHGAFNGLVYYSGKDNSAMLKVVAVRPLVTAAMPVRGNIEDLSPGMEAVSEQKKQ